MRPLAPLLALAAVAGCADALTGGDAPKVTGTMSLAVSVPGGLSARLAVKGPNSFAKTFQIGGPDAGTSAAIDGGPGLTLLELIPGNYTMTALPTVVASSVVDTVYVDPRFGNGVGLPLPVIAGEETDISVRYDVRPGSGALWISRLGDPRILTGWLGGDLLRGGKVTPAMSVAHSFDPVLETIFDRDGNLWMLTREAGSELAVFPYQSLNDGALADGGASPPTVLQAGTGLSCLAFDGTGRLWACRNGDDALISFSPAALYGTAALVPDIEVRSRGGGITTPLALAFDSVGNAWVANGNGTLAKFSPRQLAVSGFQVASIIVPLDSPGRMAFDSAGSLWAISAGKVISLAASGQVQAGSHDPAKTLPLPGFAPSSLAFDSIGNLWLFGTTVADNTAHLYLFAPGQLAVGGAQTPIEMLTSDPGAGSPSIIAFNPPPGTLPLYGAPAR